MTDLISYLKLFLIYDHHKYGRQAQHLYCFHINVWVNKQNTYLINVHLGNCLQYLKIQLFGGKVKDTHASLLYEEKHIRLVQKK